MTDSFIQILSRGVVNAENRGNKRNRKRKNKGNNEGIQQQIEARCVSQVPACETLAADSCGDDATCQAAIRVCCQSLATCDFNAFVACANAALEARD